MNVVDTTAFGARGQNSTR